MISITSKGNFKNTFGFFERVQEIFHVSNLDKYGQQGVEALKQATPVDTGKTANSWTYSIQRGRNTVSIVWSNTNINKGQNIAVLIQYGHGTKQGGYVYGRDYINPAMRYVFDDIANNVWKEVNQ